VSVLTAVFSAAGLVAFGIAEVNWQSLLERHCASKHAED
jgi:hypothetical protein